jgi:putative hemolysin
MKQISAIVLIIASVVLLMFACVSNQPPTSTARVSVRHLTPGELYAFCKKQGGLWSPPTAPGAAGVYWCLLKDGGLIACGGTMGCTYDPRRSGKLPHDIVPLQP